jgi:hypothetical protein
MRQADPEMHETYLDNVKEITSSGTVNIQYLHIGTGQLGSNHSLF